MVEWVGFSSFCCWVGGWVEEHRPRDRYGDSRQDRATWQATPPRTMALRTRRVGGWVGGWVVGRTNGDVVRWEADGGGGGEKGGGGGPRVWLMGRTAGALWRGGWVGVWVGVGKKVGHHEPASLVGLPP